MVSAQEAGGPGLNGAKHGCCVFSTDSQFRALAVDFLRRGLRDGARLLYVADGASEEALLADLAPLGDVAAMAARGALVIRSTRAAYTEHEAIEPAVQVAAYRRMTEEAVADGFSGLCVAADATALVTGEHARRRFMAYELAVDRFMAHAPMQALCAYDVRVLHEAALDLVCVHRHQRLPSGMRPGFTMWPDDDAVGVSGEVDVSNAVRFRAALDAALDAIAASPPSAGALRIDAGGLSFIDAEGTAALVSFAERAAARGGLVIEDPPRSMRAVLDTLGWTGRLAFAHGGAA